MYDRRTKGGAMSIVTKELAEKNPEFAHIFNVRYGCLEYDEKGNPVYPIYSATGKRIGKSYAIQSVKAEP
jgi:hypothetical protein